MTDKVNQCIKGENGYQIVLGTSSKYRHVLFAKHFPHILFSNISPSIDEKAIRLENTSREESDPRALTTILAHAKADALLHQLSPGTVLITSDQVVVYKGRIREKPESEDECRQFLQDYGAFPVQTVTAVVLSVIDRNRQSKRFEGVDVATQHLLPIPQIVVDKLIRKGDVMYCAGGITVEDALLRPYLGKRQGSLESIMGLPVTLVDKLFQDASINIRQTN